MFNPHPVIQSVPLFDGNECLVIDDVLLDPQGWAETACRFRERFGPSPFAYPGLELGLSPGVLTAYGDFFAAHARSRLGGRRTVQVTARYSIATMQPHELLARQWLCHRDSAGLPEELRIFASVLYLFHDEALGGTSFYRPRKSEQETAWLVHECSTLDNADFSALHPDIAAGYMVDSNAWFERVATVPARWNRAIFYDGGLFHSAHMQSPGLLSDDPAAGRLTINGFFTCRRRAT
jgi:hypothetical protein